MEPPPDSSNAHSGAATEFVSLEIELHSLAIERRHPLQARHARRITSADEHYVTLAPDPPTLHVSPPKALFATRIKWMEIQAVAHHYAAAPDGQRFLISSATDEARSVPVTIVLNWSAALKK